MMHILLNRSFLESFAFRYSDVEVWFKRTCFTAVVLLLVILFLLFLQLFIDLLHFKLDTYLADVLLQLVFGLILLDGRSNLWLIILLERHSWSVSILGGINHFCFYFSHWDVSRFKQLLLHMLNANRMFAWHKIFHWIVGFMERLTVFLVFRYIQHSYNCVSLVGEVWCWLFFFSLDDLSC